MTSRPSPRRGALLVALLAWATQGATPLPAHAADPWAPGSRLTVGLIHCRTAVDYCPGPGQLPVLRVENRHDDRLGALEAAISGHPEVGLFVTPEWYLTKRGGMHTVRELQELERSLQRITRGRGQLVMAAVAWQDDQRRYHNTTLVVGDGATVCRYSKQQEGGDELYASQYGLTWCPGQGDGYFKYKGYTFGVEMCADHIVSPGALRAADNPRYVRRDGKNVDLQVIQSCGFDRRNIKLDHLVVKNGGYVVHDDGYYSEATVYRPRARQGARPVREITPLSPNCPRLCLSGEQRPPEERITFSTTVIRLPPAGRQRH